MTTTLNNVNAHFTFECSDIRDLLDGAERVRAAAALTMRTNDPRLNIYVTVDVLGHQHGEDNEATSTAAERPADRIVEGGGGNGGEVCSAEAPACPTDADDAVPAEAPTISKDELTALLNLAVTKHPKKAPGVREIMGAFGGTRLSDIAETQWDALANKLREVIG